MKSFLVCALEPSANLHLKEVLKDYKNEYKEFDFGIGQVVSIIPIENSKVTLKGFKYPLDNYEMKFYLPLGVSNEVSEEKNSINVDGSVLLIRQIGL